MNLFPKTHSSSTPLNSLLKESSQISLIFARFFTEISDSKTRENLKKAQNVFENLTGAWKELSLNLQKDLDFIVNQKKKVTKNRIRRQSETKILRKKENDFKMKENQINETQRCLRKSLGLFRNMWNDSIKDMQKSLRIQKNLKKEIKSNLCKLDKEVGEEISDVLGLTVSDKISKTIDKELISHESAFSAVTELQDIKIPTIINVTPSENQVNDSFEFNKCMEEFGMQNQEPDSQNISIEKSIGGWKSEYDSENESFINPVNPAEIKSAISVLRKANLLSSKSNNMLEKLSNLLKSTGSTQKIELFLQIFNLQNKPKPPSSSHSSQKPPLLIPKLRKNSDDLAATPKAVFIFPDDLDLNKTILSSENPLSARQCDEINDFISELSKSSQELGDVQLEDLLKIPYMVQGIQLQTAELTEDQIAALNPGILSSEDKELSYLSVLSPDENKMPSPAKKQTNAGFDYQSTGISSQSGLRSRITLKTGGSENSQKVFTPGSRGIEESFKYL